MRLQKKKSQDRTVLEDAFDAIDAAVSQSFCIPVEKIYANETGRHADTFGRKVAMYLAHTFLSITTIAIGRRYNRNRRAVSLACSHVEDIRDDRSMDSKIESIEELLREYRA
jgi:chromosomal replication initiation ATPase DnaA